MRHVSWIGLMLLSASAWAQTGAPGAGTSPAATVDGGTPGGAAAQKPPLDVNLMPFTSETVKKVVAYNQYKIQACYEEMLAGKEKPVEGRVMTSFVVTPEGLVKKAHVLSKGTTLKDPKLHACVVEALGTFVFPKPSDRRDHPLEYPFNLKAVR
ncbi:MAG TPA: AgmX/PglI C-terminal domain-containing protein [Myxococcaceae bacterium]|nr:AgmX/PglI C-terminal domain-containing protein [Myxococcaceae bacterium]